MLIKTEESRTILGVPGRVWRDHVEGNGSAEGAFTRSLTRG